MTRAGVMSNSSPPTFATPTRAAPMPGRAPGSLPGANIAASHWPRSGHSMSLHISRACSTSTRRRASSRQLAAVRMLFDWLITGQVLPTNPAAAVRGPKHVVKTGATPVLEGAEWRKLLNSIPATTLRDLSDRALIATLTYSFARISAALKMKVEDLRPRAPDGRSGCTRKAATAQHAVPSRAGRGAARLYRRWPASSRTARAGCSAQRAGTTGASYPTRR